MADASSVDGNPTLDMTEGSTALNLPPEVVYKLVMSWKRTKYEVQVVQSDTVGDLKTMIWSLTAVPPERQKILGLVKGKLPSDEVAVVSLGLSVDSLKPKEFMMVGTAEADSFKEQAGPSPADSEYDVDYSSASYQMAQSIRNARKLKEAIEKTEIDEMNSPRAGKKLLVLDLDYAILDTSLWKEENFVASHFARPYLHQFLKAVSPFYDIIFWSQTSWRWLEQKLAELGIIGESELNKTYNTICTLSRDPMFSVYSEREGKPVKHEVKALALIWAKYPMYAAHNTVHIDDLGRNFALNPLNGIKVKPYKNALWESETDHELIWCARYLLQLVSVPDVTKFPHAKFKKCLLPLPAGVEDPKNWLKKTENSAESTENSAAAPP